MTTCQCGRSLPDLTAECAACGAVLLDAASFELHADLAGERVIDGHGREVSLREAHRRWQARLSHAGNCTVAFVELVESGFDFNELAKR